MKIVLTSNNNVKLKVTEKAFSQIFTDAKLEIIQLDFEKDGPEPYGMKGVLNQINESITEAKKRITDADYYIGMEGGVEGEESLDEVAVVLVHTAKGVEGYSRSVSFQIPRKVSSDIKNGLQLSDSVQDFLNTNNVKKGNGFVGILTNNLVTKEDLYFQPAVVAICKTINNSWYI